MARGVQPAVVDERHEANEERSAGSSMRPDVEIDLQRLLWNGMVTPDHLGNAVVEHRLSRAMF